MILMTSPQTTEIACGLREAAGACVDVLREVVAGLDPDTLPATEAPGVWALFDQGEKLCAAAKTLLARKIEESTVWKEAGMRSAAEYLALRGGTTRQAARDALKTSARLTNLPHVEDTLRRGELSAAEAHMITDAAFHDPTAQSALVDHAKVASFKELKDECLRRKATADPKPQDTRDRIYKDRHLRLTTDAEGAWRLSGRGPLDHAGVFGAALNPLIDEEFRKARAEGRREERDRLAYDALQEMARLARATFYGDDPYDNDGADAETDPDDGASALGDNGRSHPKPDDRSGNSAARAGGQANAEPSPDGVFMSGDDPQPRLFGHDGGDGTDPAAGSPGRRRRKARSRNTRRKRPNPSHLAILRLDIEALRRGYTQGDELCEVAGLGPIPVQAARDLLGDSILKLVLTKATEVASVVHLGRSPTVAQHVALLWAQPECSVEGCCHTFAQTDHRHDWHLCHETALHNLDRLCPHHHRLKTHDGWALVEGTGKRPMVPPHDPRHPGSVLPVEFLLGGRPP